MNTTPAHSLKCLDAPLAPGARRERNWSCSCGKGFYGFDSAVFKEFRSHKKEA